MIARTIASCAAPILIGTLLSAQPIAAQQSVPEMLEYKGTVVASAELEIAPRFDGIITRINFIPGQLVNKGDLLVEFMTLERELLLEIDRARQKRANAELRRTDALLKGTQTLRTRNVASEKQLLETQTVRDIAAANAEEAATKVRMSELILKEMKLYAPTTGIIGQPLMKEGTNVKLEAREKTGLAVITQLDPIRVLGRVPAEWHLQRTAVLKTPEQFKERLEITLILPNGDKYPRVGRIVGGGHEFDPQTQTIAIWAEFPNPDNLLRPGLNVTLQSRLKPS